ncbi:ELMO domain-containing protein 3-like isoform X2 [Apostichopus japonicus]|uniref:ELMO domain-containing protein 3-like isoform X2 n=1 Tax=Stichopus japonicus TaxID=307972 RepID=UPI003AB82879
MDGGDTLNEEQTTREENEVDDDDFKDSIAESYEEESVKKESFTSVNYKVSTEKYEKIDLFKMSSVEQNSSQTHSESKVEFKKTKEETEESVLSDSTHVIVKNHSHKESSSYSKVSETVTVTSNDPPPSCEAIQEEGTTEVDKEGTVEDGNHLLDPHDKLSKAKAEWDAVETIQPGKHSQIIATPLISFNEALAHFQRVDMQIYLEKIKPTIPKSGFSALKHALFGPPKMNRALHEERNLVFAIAQCPLDDNEAIHKRVLQTVYRQLTGSNIDCPRFGDHWEQIGFQGTDPATDLRACGFLGLMTLLHFVMDSQRLHVVRDIYKLSLNETQNFPFAVMSINITRIAIIMLREEVLSRECNSRKQVFAVLNDFYASVFYHMYTIWKQQHKTISDSGLVLKDVETSARRRPRILLRNFENYLSSKSQCEEKAVTGNGEGELGFAGVHELEQDGD